MTTIGISTKKIGALGEAAQTELLAASLKRTENFAMFQHDNPVFLKHRSQLISTKPVTHGSDIQPAIELTPEQKKRLKVRGSWHKAHSLIRSLVSRVTEGRVDRRLKSLRVLSCHGLDADGNQVKPPCPARTFNEKNGSHYCDECGCGKREIARVSSTGGTKDQPRFDRDEYIKLDYPELECPREQPGFSNAMDKED